MIDFVAVDRFFKDRGAETSQPFDNDLQAYSLHNGDVFAYVGKNSQPLRISLKVDEILIRHLVERYESVMPGHKLDPNKWLTLLITGQLSDQEVTDLMDRSVSLAKGL